MNITLNGTSRQIADNSSIADLINQLDLTDKRLAVEVNEDLVTRSLFETHTLADGDRVEIVQAIGGG